jgi:DNA-binding response OmpR family regulator
VKAWGDFFQDKFSQWDIMRTMRILVVEDEHRIAEAIKKGLKQERYAVDLAYTGVDGYDLATSEEYDAIVMDLMLPSMDGLAVTAKLRKEAIHTPILILTAKSQLRDKVKGLDTGADDYLAKPFAFEELLARLRALMRRPKHEMGALLQVQELSMDVTKYEVKKDKKIIELSGKEYALLEYFMRHANQVLNKDQIIAHVWDYDADILPNTIEVYVKKLRAKGINITTVRGFGYKLG